MIKNKNYNYYKTLTLMKMNTTMTTNINNMPNMPNMPSMPSMPNMPNMYGLNMNTQKQYAPPLKFYKAVATITLLTSALLEGIGKSLKKEINKRRLTQKETKQLVGSIMSNNIGQTGGADIIVEKSTPPEVEEATQLMMNIIKSIKNTTGKSLLFVTKKSYEAGSAMISKALEKVVSPEILDKSYSEINPDFTQKIKRITQNLEVISQDPQAKAALSNLTSAVADVGIDAINASMPNIERLTDKAWDVANKVGSKSIESGINVALASVMTAVANIPGVGGLVVGGLQAGKTFNNIVDVSIKAVNGFTEIANEGIDTAKTAAHTFKQSKDKLEKPIREAKQAYENVTRNMANMTNVTSAAGMTGGRKLRRQRKINKTRRLKIVKRLKKSMKAFFK